jgi:hypothetical protein
MISCPDTCSIVNPEIYETGGYVSNDNNSHPACFYQNQILCGDACCEFEPDSCFWQDKGCGWGGCDSDERGYQCGGESDCTDEICSLGETKCVYDPNCESEEESPEEPPEEPPEIVPGNNPPIALMRCNPSCAINTDTLLTLEDNGSYDPDPGDSITSYYWEIPYLSRTFNGRNFFLGNLAQGAYNVIFTVTDEHGAEGRANNVIMVSQALTADFHWYPENPYYGDSVNFFDDSEPWNRIESWSWTFEDGSPAFSAEENPSIIFLNPGQKDVTLTVTDESGNSDSITKQVEVGIPLPEWREVHPNWGEKKGSFNPEEIMDDPFLVFALLFSYFES